MWLIITLGCFAFPLVTSNYAVDPYNVNNYYRYDEIHCPEHWVQFDRSCYRFIKSPLRSYNESQKICRAFSTEPRGSDLISINSLEEHGFVINELNRQDPQHRKWYIGAHQLLHTDILNPDDSLLINMESALPLQKKYGDDYLVYSYSSDMHWSFQWVRGDEPFLFICEADIYKIQRLVEDDRDYMYGVEIDNPKEIPRGPYFIQQPKDVTFDVSRRNMLNQVVLSCLAGGYPTPTYQWFKEDYENDRLKAREINPLEDQRFTISGGMLIIMNPDEKIDRASYHCKGSNKFGTIISESVSLNFGYIHEFVYKRAAEMGDETFGKVIYCDPPKFFGKVNYYWSRDFFPNLVEENKRVFVSFDGGLYFSALETIDRGNYSCSVQAEYSDTGKTGPFFPLKVNPHSYYEKLKFANNFPKIFPNPPKAGDEVRFECIAFGYPIPSYNWTREGGEMPRNAKLESYSRVLILPNVKVEDQGDYTCTIRNEKNSLNASVTLNVQAEPNFTIPLTDKHVDSRGDLVWLCEAFGIPDVNYTWWKNGRQLVQGLMDDYGRIKMQDNVLTIENVEEERDAGMYQCRASNTLKIRYTSGQLRVLSFRPSFKKRPLEPETYAADRGNVTIVCNPEAAPKPTFIWKKDGNVLGSGGHRRILENGNLLITQVSRDDEGVYTCTASNALGMDESRGRLIVLRGPRIFEALRPIVVTSVGHNFEFYCKADIEELLDIAYIWRHNGLHIRDIDIRNSNNRIIIDGSYFRISNATFSDAGEYECIVQSAVGTISSKSIVTVEGPPGQPGGVQVRSIRKNYVVLSWTDGALHGRPILSYTISGRTNWNETWVNLTHAVVAREIDRYNGRKEADVGISLIPWASYEFKVAAWNELGIGLPSAPSPRHATPPDVPFLPPSNVGGGGGKKGDLTITWTPLKPDQQNAPGIYYKVYFKLKDHDPEFQTAVLREYGNTGRAVINILSDYFYREYVVKVQSLNSMGEGPISKEVEIYSAEEMPMVSPQLVVATSYNSSALKISWKPIKETREAIRGKLIGHRIKYWRMDHLEEDAVYYLSRTTRPWALIVGLMPDTYYYVKVMAYNSAGEGPESERYIERTYKRAPQKPPSSVHAYGVNPSTIRVTWRYVQPTPDEEPLQGFKIRIWEYDQDMSTANDTVIQIGGKLETYIDTLTPGKTYRLRVLAYSNGGDGRMSSPVLSFQMGNPQAFRSGSSPRAETISIIFTVGIAVILHNVMKIIN